MWRAVCTRHKTLQGYSCSATSQYQAAPRVRKGNSLPIGFNASIASAAPNYTAQCVAAQQAHVTALVILAQAPTDIKVGADCSRQNYNPTYVLLGSGFSMQIAKAPGIGKNLWVEYPVLPFWANTASIRAMNAVGATAHLPTRPAAPRRLLVHRTRQERHTTPGQRRQGHLQEVLAVGGKAALGSVRTSRSCSSVCRRWQASALR